MARKRRAASKRGAAKRASNAKKSKKAEAEAGPEQVETTVIEKDSEPEAKKIKIDEGSEPRDESAAAPPAEQNESETEVEMSESEPEVNSTAASKEIEPEGQIEAAAPSKESEGGCEAEALSNGKESEPELDNAAAPKESEKNGAIVDGASKEQVVGESETGTAAQTVKEPESEDDTALVEKASDECQADTAAAVGDLKSEPVTEVETAEVEKEEGGWESATILITKPVAGAAVKGEAAVAVADVGEGGNGAGATLHSETSPMKTDESEDSDGSAEKLHAKTQFALTVTVDVFLADLQEYLSGTPNVGDLKASAFVEKLRASFEAFFGNIIDNSGESKAKEMKLLMAEKGANKFSAVVDWKHLQELLDAVESGNWESGISGKGEDAQNVMNNAEDLKVTADICREYFELTKTFMKEKLHNEDPLDLKSEMARYLGLNV